MNKLYKEIILLSFVLSLAIPVMSQSGTMYYMGTVPQTYYLNPATQPECSFYLGLPIASPLQMSYYNSGFSLNDIFWTNPETDSLNHPFSSTAAADRFLSNLNDVEFIRFDMAVNLASFGFRAGDMYFSFDATARGNEYISYPKDLASFILKGNKNGDVFDLSALNFELLNYVEYGVNISKSFGSTFSVGVRPKVLFGLATLVTQDTDITIETSTDEWIINSKFNAKLSVVGANIPVDDDGIVAPLEYLGWGWDSTITENPEQSWKRAFSDNLGFGVDIGAHFKPTDQIQLSFSALDLGYIKWKEEPHIVSHNGSFTFQGIEWNPSDTSNYGDYILDTIKANLEVTGSNEPFTTYLRPKIIVGGRLFLTQGFDVGVLYKTEYFKKKVNQDITLLANWHPFKAFSLSASYSLLSKSYSTFGLGMGLKLGPLNMYIISDYIPAYWDTLPQDGLPFNVPIPAELYNANIRLGLNLVFGCNQAKRMGQDKPLFNSSNWLF